MLSKNVETSLPKGTTDNIQVTIDPILKFDGLFKCLLTQLTEVVGLVGSM